jgi:hypothetical protein
MKTAGCRISCSLERFGGVDKRRPNVFAPKNSLPPTGLEIMIILDLCTHRQDTHGILLGRHRSLDDFHLSQGCQAIGTVRTKNPDFS